MAAFLVGSFAMCYKRFVKKILSVSMSLLALFSSFQRIDGLYHFENIQKGEYTIHAQDPNVKEPNLGPAAYRRVSVAEDNAVIELDPAVIDCK
jgi:hypothetical protein